MPTKESRSKKVYRLKVTLSYITPPIWRRLLVRGDLSLGMLHSIIQIAMGWTNSHLHQFKHGQTIYADASFELEPDLDESPVLDEYAYTLIQALPGEKTNIEYIYDFGDGWRHLIAVEKIVDRKDSRGPLAECLDGKNACPPDDCGGIGGYMELKKIIKNPKHKEYESMLDWLGNTFDPAAFDKDKVNKFLLNLKSPLISESQLARILMKRDGYRDK